MSRFDVHAWSGTDAFVVDCQADLLADLPTRFAVPLVPQYAGRTLSRLNPTFIFCGMPLILVPQLATTMSVRELGERRGSLSDEDYRITAAIDMLMFGF